MSLRTLVASAVPSACATDCAANPLLLKLIAASVLPAATLAGEMQVSVGAGFDIVTEAEAPARGADMLAALTITTLGDGGASGAV